MGITPQPCILIFGGSFDPVHSGHVALAKHFVTLMRPQELRIIPTGQPWQKNDLIASAEHRVAMLELAFADDIGAPIVIDQRELIQAEQQKKPNYTIETLSALRAEMGKQTCIVFVIGADQSQNLHTWKEWRQLFSLAHICAATRPGFSLDEHSINKEVAREWSERSATPQEIRQTNAGKTYLANNLAWDVSATDIRRELKQKQQTTSLIPAKVLDYIQQHHLYR
jgi:nicotinate-nucleotide adenylyltransferase